MFGSIVFLDPDGCARLAEEVFILDPDDRGGLRTDAARGACGDGVPYTCPVLVLEPVTLV